MTVSQELVWLISQIRSTSSVRERLRLLALGWRTLRGLSAADRLAVARELGFDGAEQLVEQLATRGGASPSLLLEGLDALKSTDPDEVGGLVRGLTEPDRRVDTAERLMDAASNWLSEEAAIAEAASDGPSGREPTEFDEPVVEVRPPPPPPPPPPEVAEVELPQDVVPEDQFHVEEIDVGEVELVDDGEVAPTVEGEAPEPQPVAEDREEAPAPVVVMQSASSEDEAVEPPAALVESAAARLAAVASLGSRFRVLAGIVDELEGFGAHHLTPVVDVFPEGWARRRAIETLLRAGVPGQIGEAIALVSTLERPSERMWALSTLATSRELDEDEREAVIAAAGSPMVERRLRRRLAR